MINIVEIESFLKFFLHLPQNPGSEDQDRFTTAIFNFCLLNDSNKRPVANYGVWFAKAHEAIATLSALKVDASLHVTLNETGLNGRKLSDVEAARVLCVDLDRSVEVQEVRELKQAYSPHMIVRSSPTKYHFYWQLEPGLDLDTWSQWQLAYGFQLRGDLSLRYKNKTIRVPGVSRRTKDGVEFTPQIVYMVDWADIEKVGFANKPDWVGAAYEGGVLALEKERRALKELYREKFSVQALQKLNVSETGRNNALYFALKNDVSRIKDEAGDLIESVMDREEVLELAEEYNSHFEEPLSDEEVSSVVDSAYARGRGLFEARHAALAVEHEKVVSILDQDSSDGGVEGVDITVDREFMLKHILSPQMAERLSRPKESSLILEAGRSESEATDSDALEQGSDDQDGDLGGEDSAMQGLQNGHSNGVGVLKKNSSSRKNGVMVDSSLRAGSKIKVGHLYDYDQVELQLARFSEAAIAERVIQRFRGKIVKVVGVLYAFDDETRTWGSQRVDNAILVKYVTAAIRDSIADPEFDTTCCTDRDGHFQPERKRMMLERFRSHRLISSVLGIVKNFHGYPQLTTADFDADPELFYCQNGVLDLRTMQLREPRAEDYLMQRAEVRFDPEARSEFWEVFVREIFEDSEELYEYLQMVFGYSITGYISAQLIFVHFGSGANGKSKILDALSRLTGGYGTRLGCSTFAKSGNSFTKEFERLAAKIEGKRCAIIDDLDTATKWNEGFIKSLTGEVNVARKLYEEERDVANRSKFHIGCNEAPEPEGENRGLLRRVIIIPYNRVFTPIMGVELKLQAAIKRDLPAILNWALQGLGKLRAKGFEFPVPEAIKLMKEDYTHEHFKLDQVLAELLEKPSDEEMNFRKSQEACMHSLDEILNEVNARMPLKRQINSIVLGRALSQDLGLKSVRVGRAKKVIYFVKFLQQKGVNKLLL